MIDTIKTILIVDDNPENIKIIAETLNSDDIKLAFAQSGEEALQRLENNTFDLILMDIMMPGLNGFETVKIIKENPEHNKTPIIFLTALDDVESIEKAFIAGGADYLVKPFRPKELMIRVQYQLERKDFIEKLDYLACKDVLTDIYNRRKFFELAIEEFSNNENKLFAAIIDIDHFKSVNDNYGHQVGDQVIKTIASTINVNLPEDAIFGRIGGEEFAVLFTENSMNEAKSQIDKIRQLIEQTKITLDNGQDLNNTISIGLAEKSDEMQTIDQLLLVADEALFGAKKSGRNRVDSR